MTSIKNTRRNFIKGFCLMPFTTICFNEAFAALEQKPAAVVDLHHTGKAGEIVDGVPVYQTVEQALNAAPDKAQQAWVISIKLGRYHEKLTVTKPNISLVGAGRDSTIITFDAFAGQDKPDGQGKWGTAGSATITVQAEGFSSHALTISNDFDYLTADLNEALPGQNRALQAVALMLGEGADKSLFHDVALTGYQDTLYANEGRSLFAACHISGNVDFIFGAGVALFEKCDIVSRRRASAETLPAGYITAPSTMIDQPCGLVFSNCRLMKESSDVAAGSYFLGRPWHPTKTFEDGRYADPNAIGLSVFLNCHMDDHIAEDGWTQMSGTAISGEKKWFKPLQDARFFEHGSTGPGAHVNEERPQLDAAKAQVYSVKNVLGDWQPLPIE